MQSVNLAIFRWINHSWPDSWTPFLRFFSVALNMAAIKGLLVVVVVGMLVRGLKSRIAVVQAILAVALANTLTQLFKDYLPMHRPYQEFADVINRVGTSSSMGTASAHSANMAAVAFVMTYHLRWWGTPWIAVAILTGCSRVFVGAHYPYQVALGWICGIVAGIAVPKVWERIQMRRENVEPSEA